MVFLPVSISKLMMDSVLLEVLGSVISVLLKLRLSKINSQISGLVLSYARTTQPFTNMLVSEGEEKGENILETMSLGQR